jgi:hypothetical protein
LIHKPKLELFFFVVPKLSYNLEAYFKAKNAMIAKKDCPECYTRTITFNPENGKFIKSEKARLLKTGKRRNIDQIINKIITEYKAWSDHQQKPSTDVSH